MKHLNKAAIAATTILALTPLTAIAESGFYIGGSVGSSSLTDDFGGFDVDANSTSFRLNAGWQFNDFFSLEGGYHNFGDFEQSFNVGGNPFDIRLKADGFTLGATGSIPLGERFALFGRAGAFFWDGDAEINSVSQATPEDTNPYLGAGAKFAITDHLSLAGDWTRYELDDTESDVISLGLTYRF
jgi:OOP family OmpA-OmpF porin